MYAYKNIQKSFYGIDDNLMSYKYKIEKKFSNFTVVFD